MTMHWVDKPCGLAFPGELMTDNLADVDCWNCLQWFESLSRKDQHVDVGPSCHDLQKIALLAPALFPNDDVESFRMRYIVWRSRLIHAAGGCTCLRT